MSPKIKSFIIPLMLILISFSSAQYLLNESFTGTTFPPTGWLRLNYGGGETWKRVTAKYYSFPACTEMKTDRADINNDWLITPRIGPMGESDSLIFYYLTGSTTLYETLKVRVSLNSTQSDTAKYDTTLCIISANNASVYNRKAVWLGQSRFSGKQIYIAFQVRVNKKKKWIHLDDIQVYRFSTQTYTINANAYGAGSITPSGPILIESGKDTTFYLQAEPGYHLDSLKVDGVNHGRDSTRYKFTSVTSNHTIDAYYPVRSYALNITIVGGGTVIKNPDATSYPEGTNVDLTAVPDPTWHFYSWSGDISSNDTTINVVMDTVKNITATFKRDTWTIYATTDGNGTINPPGISFVAGGGSKSYTIAPYTGYHIQDVLVDDSSIGAVSNYTFTDVNKNHTIHAMFEINTYTLTVNKSGNGDVIIEPDQSYYDYGTWVKLTAMPDTGWQFVNWTGGLNSFSSYDSILMNGDKTVQANFTIKTYTLTWNANPPATGMVSLTPPTGPYNHGTWVKLQPNPSTGYHFVEWGDSLTGSSVPDSVYMNSNKIVTANFAINTYMLTVNISGAGNVIKDPDQLIYNHGTWVKLTATPDTGNHFVNWTGNLNSNNPYDSIKMDGDKTVNANFTINTYSLSVNVNPSGSGTVTKTPPTGPYNHGTWVKLQPNPNAGWHFMNWTDSLTGSNDPDSIYMNSDKIVTANFSAYEYSLTININGLGSVTREPNLSSYTYGTWVKLTAVAETGWHFVNWTGHLGSSNSYDSIYIDGNKTVNANFVINTYLLSVSINPPGTGYVSLNPATGPYPHGTWVKLEPFAYTGYHFTSWSGNLTGSNIPDSIYMNGTKNVTANFAINYYTLNITIVGNGNVTKTPDTITYRHNSVVRLNAYPAPGWFFDEWGGDLTGTNANPEYILMDGDKDVIAYFITNRFTLDVYTTGNGYVTKDPDSANYANGTLVYLTAHPSPGDEFVYWSGNLSGYNNPESIRMTGHKIVLAHFTDNDNYALRVNVIGQGMVIREPNQQLYAPGTWVKLSAIPDSGWYFMNWMGNLISNKNPDSLLMDGNKDVTARFSTSGTGTWVQMESMPPLNAGSMHIKDGGALVGVENSKDGSVLYAFRGTKTKDMKKYTIGEKSGWSNAESIPFGYKFPPSNPPKLNKKYPGKGAAMCYDGNNIIYATKGSGTREFWAYYIDTAFGLSGETLVGWKPKAFIPTVSGLKGGTSIRYYAGKVYLLAGAQKKDMSVNNFYVYDPTQDTSGGSPWTTLGKLPLGPNIKAWKDGSSIVEAGGIIYAIKGGDKVNLFYMYDIVGDTWHRLEDLPLSDTSMEKYKKTLKVKDGAASASDGNVIYATKGGGANVFWCYIPGSPGMWKKLASIPYLHKKSVPKSGSAMAYADGRIWLLKGNKTPEFWCYTPSKEKSSIKYQISNMNTQTPATHFLLHNPVISILPNPFSKLTTIQYIVPVTGKVSIKLYNTTGKLVSTLLDENKTAGSYSLELRNSTLGISSGVYFIKYETELNKSEVKLIVQ